MIKLTRHALLLAAAISLSSAVRAAPGEGWPHWRGPDFTGISRETDLATTWPTEGPKKDWSVPTGTGHASPVIADDKLYLFTRDEEKNQELLTAYDIKDGKQLWQQSYEGGYNKQSDPTWHGTRATPWIESGKIYTFGGTGDLICREIADGKEVWHINVLKETKGKDLEWGCASSPLIVGDLIYVQGGVGAGAPVAVAVNKNDGKLAWESEAKGASEGKNHMTGGYGGGYAAPLQIMLGGKPQIVILGGQAVYGMDPASGKTLWQQEWVTSYDVNATTPIYSEPNLFISTGYSRGCLMLEVKPDGVKKLWENKSLASKYPQLILDRKCIYGNSAGTLKCLSWPDGKVLWEAKDSADRLGEGGSLVRFGDYLITLSDRGKLTLAKATEAGFQKVSQVKEVTPGKNVWAAPVIYHGKLYVKGVNELLCLDISGK